MGKVVTQASMSLYGFSAGPNDQVGPLFDWYGNGDVEVTGTDPDLVFHVSAASAEYLGKAWANVAPLLLEGPEIVQGDRVTHLHYRVRK
jgi:hypothetical protein